MFASLGIYIRTVTMDVIVTIRSVKLKSKLRKGKEKGKKRTIRKPTLNSKTQSS